MPLKLRHHLDCPQWKPERLGEVVGRLILPCLALLASCLCSCSAVDKSGPRDPFVTRTGTAQTLQPRRLEPGSIVARAQSPSVEPVPPTPLPWSVGQAPEFSGSLADRFPDEYLLDGGDRDNPVHYGRFQRFGFDTEDTISEYVDHLGRERLDTSSRVAIYAPRFGAVRTVSSPQQHYSAENPAGTLDVSRISGLRYRNQTVHHQHNDVAEGIRVRSRVSGLNMDEGRSGLYQVQVAGSNTKLLNVFQDLNFIRTGEMIRAEEARLAYGIQAAFVWTRDQYPVIAAVTTGSQEVYVPARPDELAGTDDGQRSTGRLRIVKLADKKTATAGDVITFTIRYDNQGDHEIHHVRILDNLTPRLEYVDDSATSDRPGRLVVEDNGEGSLILQWELFDPLAGHAGGVVTFKTRVR